MNKISTNDIENLTKASQGANLLLSDLRALTSSKSSLLFEAVFEMTEMVAQIDKKLARLVSAVDEEMDEIERVVKKH